MRYVNKSNVTCKYTKATLPILKRGIQDHAFREIARTVSSSCIIGRPNLIAEGSVPFKYYRRVLIRALADDPSHPLGTETTEDTVRTHLSSRDETIPDFAQVLRESMTTIGRATPGLTSSPISSKQ